MKRDILSKTGDDFIKESKKNKNNVWKYAIILFTSAFVVLLLTAYSQIKFNRNIDNYKNQIYNEENAKNEYRVNLKTALEENVTLKEQNEQLKKQMEESKKQLENIEKEKNKIRDNLTDVQGNYEVFILAQSEYKKGNVINTAELLYSRVKQDLLGLEAKKAYEFLSEEVFKDAAQQLYEEGYSLYKAEEYSEAADRFLKSLRYSEDSYFSDDCYFFVAYCEYYQENYERSVDYIEQLLKKYPESTYKEAAENLKQLINK